MASRHRTIVAGLLAVAIACGCAAQVLAQGSPQGPTFSSPPRPAPKPGTLQGVEPLKGLPAGIRGWRIRYATTIDNKTPATAKAMVFAAEKPPPGIRPVILWEHGTTGLIDRCMPSASATPQGIPAFVPAMNAGWVIVATDYSFAERGGPHPYLIGEGEARAGLDSVRALNQMTELSVARRTVIWGHSQGGHAALWTASIAARYAPDVVIMGAVAIAPAADMEKLLAADEGIDKRLGPYVAAAYSRFYPDVKFDDAVRPPARAAARQIAALCPFAPGEAQQIARLTQSFPGRVLATDTNKALVARLRQNAANSPISTPLMIAQGMTDVVVPPQATNAYAALRCGPGQNLDYFTFAGRDHGGIVQPGSPLEGPLMAWTKARFDRVEPTKGCNRKAY